MTNEMFKWYTHEGALHFPLWPGAQDTAWRYIFDWAIAGQALLCSSGDRVLEFASGSGYASELLNRLGYNTVAVDLNPELLTYARERMTLDQRLVPKRSTYVAGDGQRLPFDDATFDGVLCLNALHHMPSYELALAEIRRVLKPGCRAVFSEPGSQHADLPESKLAREQFGEVEKNIFLDEIHRIATQVGFERMLLKPYVYPQLVSLDYKDLGRFGAEHCDELYTRPRQIAQFMHETHSIFVLKASGSRPVTSAIPGILRAKLRISDLPKRMQPGQEITVRTLVQNCGDTIWLAQPRELGGHVTFGARLVQIDGRLLTDELGRTVLDHDVAPGQEIAVLSAFRLPDALSPGGYVLRFDMVDEKITWFEQRGSPVVDHVFAVGVDPATLPRSLP